MELSALPSPNAMVVVGPASSGLPLLPLLGRLAHGDFATSPSLPLCKQAGGSLAGVIRDEIQSPCDRFIAHMRRDPFEDAARLHGFPFAAAKLLRAATVLEPGDRPSPLEFGREFAAAL